MALQITKTQGYFKIEGAIVLENIEKLTIYFEKLLREYDEIIISLNQVIKIDPYGVFLLKKFYRNALLSNKVFCLIGKENQVINKAFGTNSKMIWYNCL